MQELTEAWEREREEMKHLQNIKGEIDRVNLEVQNAERDYDLNHAAELKYGTLMTLQKQLKEAEAALQAQVPPPPLLPEPPTGPPSPPQRTYTPTP